jgi:DNA-binding FadR family transcriptional regulator
MRRKQAVKSMILAQGAGHVGKLELPREGSVHLAISRTIGSRIVRGDFQPGEILPNEADWAAGFGVSRSAVREAVKILMAKGLLTSRPKVGSRIEPREHWNLLDHDILEWHITGPGRGQVMKSLQQFRRIFEPEAAALAAQFRSEEQMAAISESCRQMATAATVPERTAADVRFHLGILRATGNELLIPLGVLIDSALRNLFVFITVESGDVHHAQDLHDTIEKAIRQRKPEVARRAVHRLLDNSDELIAHYTFAPSRR